MEHVTVKATEVETGEAAGSFVALVSTFGPEPDRHGERILPGAFQRSLERWQASRQMIPVLSDHLGEVSAVIGRIDPRLSRESGEGLEVSGVIDTSTELGARVYRLVKDGALSWSIGYVVPSGASRRQGKVTEISEVDLAEVSVTPVPANPGVRTISVKSATAIESLSDAELRERSLALVEQALAPEPPPEEAPFPTREELDEEKNALVERSRAEYMAARAAEAAAQEKKEAMRWRMYNFPRPRTRIELQPNGTYKRSMLAIRMTSAPAWVLTPTLSQPGTS